MTVNDAYWVGAHDAGNNNTFVWLAGGDVLPDDSPLWEPGEPDHGSHDDCVVMNKSNGKLYDTSCTIFVHFVCESV